MNKGMVNETIAKAKASNMKKVATIKALAEQIATPKAFAPTEYTIADDETIARLGRVTGRNCMKSQYNYRGLEDYNPNNPDNKATLDDFVGNATLGIYEYIIENGLYNEPFTDETLHNCRLAGYKKCNIEGKAVRQKAFKHLYLDAPSYDDEGNEIGVDYIDITAEIRATETIENNEILAEIMPHFKQRQVQVIKYIAQGYTDETIAKKLDCTRQNINKIKHTIHKKAVAIAKGNSTLAEQLKDFIK